MMIKKAREKIDKLDAELVKLFEQRMDIVTTIADYKKQHNLIIADINREQEIIRHVTKLLHNPVYSPQLIEFFECLMKITKMYQDNYCSNK